MVQILAQCLHAVLVTLLRLTLFAHFHVQLQIEVVVRASYRVRRVQRVVLECTSTMQAVCGWILDRAICLSRISVTFYNTCALRLCDAKTLTRAIYVCVSTFE